MTIKLYDNDSYATEFDARVISCEKVGDIYKVLLDSTLFFPEEGGQSSDTGYLEDVEVIHAELAGDEIFHHTREPVCPGKKVHGKIDFAPRFRNMQNHSGEHIICGVAHKLFGYNNVGFHLGSDYVTMDLDGDLSPEDISLVEQMANRVVIENKPIEARYLSDEEIHTLEYRAKGDITENVRLVTIGDADACACCAPHVRSTGEIGMIKILDAVHHKGGMRLSILCGFDALADYNKILTQLKEISRCISVPRDNVSSGVKKLTEDITELKIKLGEKTRQIIDEKISKIEPTDKNICLFANDLDAGHLRLVANDLKEKTSGYSIVLTGDDKAGYRYIIISRDKDVSQVVQEANKQLDGKGGGRGNMASGTFGASSDQIEKYFE